MFTTVCFRDDFDDFEGFVMPSIRGGGGSSAFLEESGSNTNTVHERLGPGSWSAEK